MLSGTNLLRLISHTAVAACLSVAVVGCTTSENGADGTTAKAKPAGECCEGCETDATGKAVVQNEAKPTMGTPATRPTTAPAAP